jgi:hypothetical protein
MVFQLEISGRAFALYIGVEERGEQAREECGVDQKLGFIAQIEILIAAKALGTALAIKAVFLKTALGP